MNAFMIINNQFLCVYKCVACVARQWSASEHEGVCGCRRVVLPRGRGRCVCSQTDGQYVCLTDILKTLLLCMVSTFIELCCVVSKH